MPPCSVSAMTRASHDFRYESSRNKQSVDIAHSAPFPRKWESRVKNARLSFPSWVPACDGDKRRGCRIIYVFTIGGLIFDLRSSHSGTGNFFERRNSGLNSLDW